MNFNIEFQTLEGSMEGNYSCENGMVTVDNFVEVFMQVDGMWLEWGQENFFECEHISSLVSSPLAVHYT